MSRLWTLAEPDLLQPIPEHGMNPWWIAGVAIVIVFAIFVGRNWFRKEAVEEPTEPLPDPEEAALDALKNLESHPLNRDADFEAFYVLLSQALRRFIGAIFDMDALTKISDEIRTFVSERGSLPEASRQRLFLLLEQSDWVKFSTNSPFPEQARKDLAEAGTFVRNVAESMRERNGSKARKTGGEI